MHDATRESFVYKWQNFNGTKTDTLKRLPYNILIISGSCYVHPAQPSDLMQKAEGNRHCSSWQKTAHLPLKKKQKPWPAQTKAGTKTIYGKVMGWLATKVMGWLAAEVMGWLATKVMGLLTTKIMGWLATRSWDDWQPCILEAIFSNTAQDLFGLFCHILTTQRPCYQYILSAQSL